MTIPNETMVPGWPSRVAIALIRLYQLTLSPVVGGGCRFVPSCSAYAIDAIRMHGAVQGSGLALRRVSRCHPFGASGVDPVPPARPRA